MSDYAFLAERARKIFSSVARLESELQRKPDDWATQRNLASMRKLANQAREELDRLAAQNQFEVCDYRLVPGPLASYALAPIGRSLLSYQYLFSQIYDSIVNGKKERTRIGKEAAEASALEFAYSYSGSLAVVLLAKSEKDFFTGKLDPSIGALYQIMDIDSGDGVRQVAHEYGEAVVKRIHEWSAANVEGGFSADVRWKRSDGRQLGQVIDRARMERIVEFIDATEDVKTEDIPVRGILVAVSFPGRTFHIVEPDGESYKGFFAPEFDVPSQMTVGKIYDASVRVSDTYHYATEQHTKVNHLLRITPLRGKDAL